MVHDWHGDSQTYCPPLYWDLAIGSGPCGLGCRGCYLLGTFRDRRDPWQPVIYDNFSFLWEAVRRWLIAPQRKRIHSLGLGADRSDSLLFEGVLGHLRHLAPMFDDPKRNPCGCKLFLLTKTANVQYLRELPTRNTIVTFSLNPEAIADLWEGKWPDTGERITPSIENRLQASLDAQLMGFEVRWRIDPILTPEGWLDHYEEFLRSALAEGHQPTRITVGTFRETTPQLDLWRERWNLPAMEWRPESLIRDGTHWHADVQSRIRVYKAIAELCNKYLPRAELSLCKETKTVRQLCGLNSPNCNCLGDLGKYMSIPGPLMPLPVLH